MILPFYISLSDWAHSLLIDFPNDNVPILYNEEEWKEWGNDVTFCPTFEKTNAPSTDFYNNWQEWALALYLSSGFVQG